MTGYSAYYLEKAAVQATQRVPKRIPRTVCPMVLKEVRRQLKNTSPSGAAYNPNFFDPDIDRALATVEKLEYHNQQEIHRIRSNLPRATPPPRRLLPCSLRPSMSNATKSYELPSKRRTFRVSHTHSSRLPPRWKSTPLHLDPAFHPSKRTQAQVSSPLNTTKLEQTFEQIQTLQQGPRIPPINLDGFTKCAEYAHTLSEYLQSRDQTDSFEDLLALKRGDRRVNKHCRQDSLQMKREAFRNKIDAAKTPR